MTPVSLGIDTSCYTTSVAIITTDLQEIADYRQLLKVPPGERGLMQSQAVFQHVHHLPDLLLKALEQVDQGVIQVVAASYAPRPQPGSYMPVFKVGEGSGKTLARALGIPFVPVSHQEGHLAAGWWSAGVVPASRFLAVHLSGGTSELLLVEKGDHLPMEVTILGGTTDLHAGQFIDRVGVRMGLPFPAGRHLETLARKAGGQYSIPSSVDGYAFSFSGPESQAQRLLDQGTEPAAVARSVEMCIANTMEKVLRKAMEEFECSLVLMVGGVAANGFLRQRLVHRLGHPAVGGRLVFAQPRHSTDNALGVALLGAMVAQDIT